MAVAPSIAQAEVFVNDAEVRLARARETLNRTLWVKQNFITVDTDQLAADATEAYNNLIVDLLKQAKTYDSLDLSADLRRKLELLKRQIDLPPRRACEVGRAGEDHHRTRQHVRCRQVLQGRHLQRSGGAV